MFTLGGKKIILSLILGIVVLFGATNFSLAATQQPSGGQGVTSFKNPLNYNTVDELLMALLNRLQGVIVIIALIFIIIGALLYITSSGNESRMTMAKAAVVASMIGLAIGVAAPAFLKEIYTALGKGSSPDEQCSHIIDPVANQNCIEALEGALSITQIAYNVLNFLLSVVGVVAIIMLVASGIMYLTAAGNETQIESAKKTTRWAIVGIAIAIGSLIIVKQIAKFFGN